ncbi:RloB family protein [Saccharopolyspora sp. CA-218241]|uniref:RloB family protein n=1 Tax=Saccharopolyspora sp. CA-218241 TaxID=3240027 RepID=UPI003D9A0AFD
MTQRTRRENTRRRRPPQQESRPILLVVYGAARTEKDYVEAVCASHPESARVTGQCTAVDPATLVRKAVKIRELHSRDYDEVWCVVDVDSFDLAPALAAARKAGVQVAVSNVCFEYWLLLHFEDSGEAFRDGSEVIRRLRRHVAHYDKTTLDFADFAPGVAAAVQRAEGRCAAGLEHHRNPSTGMWRLVRALVPGRY